MVIAGLSLTLAWAHMTARASLALLPQLATQDGHIGKVTLLAFSGNGHLLISAGSDGAVKVWDVRDGLQLRTLHRHPALAVRAALAPDSDSLAVVYRSKASIGAEDQVEIWDIQDGRVLKTLAGMGVDWISFSPDGRKIALTERSGIRIWDLVQDALSDTFLGSYQAAWFTSVEGASTIVAIRVDGEQRTLMAPVTGKVLALLPPAVRSIAVAPDGRLFAVLSSTSSLSERLLPTDTYPARLFLIDVNSGTHIMRSDLSATGAPMALGNRTLVLQGGEKVFTVWRAPFAEPPTSLSITSWATALAASGDVIASATHDHSIQLWDATSAGLLQTFWGASDRVEALTFDPSGNTLVAGPTAVGGRIAWWDLRSGGLSRLLTGGRPLGPYLTPAQERRVLMNAALADSAAFEVTDAFVTMDSPRAEWGWSPKTQELILGLVGSLRSVSFHPSGERLVAGSLNRAIHIWEETAVPAARALAAHYGRVQSVAFSPRGDLLASGGEDGRIRLWDAKTFATLHFLQAPATPRPYVPGAGSAPISALAFTPDGRWLAAARKARTNMPGDGSIELWDLESRTLLRTLPGTNQFAHQVALTHDRSLLAAPGPDNNVKIWDTHTGKVTRDLQGHSGPVVSALFSPDDRWLASASQDATVRVWDVRRGVLQHELRGHNAAVWAVAFSPDGRMLVSGGADTTIRIWDVATGAPLAAAMTLEDGAEWLVTSPSGSFDGSPGGWRRIRWRLGSELRATVPVEQYFGDFYHPGLLGDILSGRMSQPTHTITALDRRQPIVTVSASSGGEVATRTLAVRVAVSEIRAPAEPVGSGARDVRLFRNGSLVRVWRGDVLRKASNVTLAATVPIAAGLNRLTAYGFNRDNVKSADAELLVRGSESLKRPATLYILAVGIDRYMNPDYDLKYAVADAREFAEGLRRQQVSLGNFGRIEVITLLDESATKANLLLALRRLGGTHVGLLPPTAAPQLARLTASQPEDAVIMFYAGHGTAQGAQFYLIPHDLGHSGKRAALNPISLKSILAHSISDLDLERTLEKVDAKWMLLVIDACNSGQALEADEKRRGPMNSRGLAQLAYEKGLHILASSQSYQAALETAALGHGYLTYALVNEGLNSSVADTAPEDGQILLREWLDYAVRRVPEMQVALMRKARKQGRDIAFVEGEEKILNVDRRSLQRPRVFYRRETDATPLVIAKTQAESQSPTPSDASVRP